MSGEFLLCLLLKPQEKFAPKPHQTSVCCDMPRTLELSRQPEDPLLCLAAASKAG